MKTDARVRYTKMRIREAFFQCLREKPVSRITVKELCDLAEINRATFYSHYLDVFDLLEQLEQEVLAQMRELALRPQDSPGDGVLLRTLRGLQNDRSEARLLASPNADPNFGARVSAVFQDAQLPRLEERFPRCTPAQRSYIYHFIAGGCAGILNEWTRGGMTESPEELAEQINQLCKAAVTAYEG